MLDSEPSSALPLDEKGRLNSLFPILYSLSSKRPDWIPSVRDQTQCDQPPVLPGVVLPPTRGGTQPRQSLEVLILPVDPPVFGRQAGSVPRATPRIDGVLDLRPPLQKPSPAVVVPHPVPQHFEKSKPKRSALTGISADRILLHRSSSSRRGTGMKGSPTSHKIPIPAWSLIAFWLMLSGWITQAFAAGPVGWVVECGFVKHLTADPKAPCRTPSPCTRVRSQDAADPGASDR